MASSEDGLTPAGILSSKVNPSYLHSNSTSHTWPFSAIAELIDNAYDPDVNSKYIKIDVTKINGETCLTFTDNGNGMTSDNLHKMLSFGFCEKEGVDGRMRGHVPIGQYGNGFKSGSMRLGKDVLVFTKSHDGTMSLGFLSQTFLIAIDAETILVPIVSWNKITRESLQSSKNKSLEYITKYSIFHSEDEIFAQFDFDCIEEKTGTRIIIYSLTQGCDKVFELDFDKAEDILNPENADIDKDDDSHNQIERQEVSEYRKSLKKYCEILFLNKRMDIYLRGSKVKENSITQKLIRKKVEDYKPNVQQSVQRRSIKITLGKWNEEQRQVETDYGAMFYCKNRLIKAYEKVGCQRQLVGRDVVAIIDIAREMEGFEPVHNKQDFRQNNKFSALMKKLAIIMNKYCIEFIPLTTGKKSVVCSLCSKTRYLRDDMDMKKLKNPWFCNMNTDSTYNRCSVKEQKVRKNKNKNYNKASGNSQRDLLTPHSRQERNSASPKDECNNSDDESIFSTQISSSANRSPGQSMKNDAPAAFVVSSSSCMSAASKVLCNDDDLPEIAFVLEPVTLSTALFSNPPCSVVALPLHSCTDDDNFDVEQLFPIIKKRKIQQIMNPSSSSSVGGASDTDICVNLTSSGIATNSNEIPNHNILPVSHLEVAESNNASHNILSSRKSKKLQEWLTNSKSVQTDDIETVSVQVQTGHDLQTVNDELKNLRQNVAVLLEQLSPERLHYENLSEIDIIFAEFVKINSRSHVKPQDSATADCHLQALNSPVVLSSESEYDSDATRDESRTDVKPKIEDLQR